MTIGEAVSAGCYWVVRSTNRPGEQFPIGGEYIATTVSEALFWHRYWRGSYRGETIQINPVIGGTIGGWVCGKPSLIITENTGYHIMGVGDEL